MLNYEASGYTRRTSQMKKKVSKQPLNITTTDDESENEQCTYIVNRIVEGGKVSGKYYEYRPIVTSSLFERLPRVSRRVIETLLRLLRGFRKSG